MNTAKKDVDLGQFSMEELIKLYPPKEEVALTVSSEVAEVPCMVFEYEKAKRKKRFKSKALAQKKQEKLFKMISGQAGNSFEATHAFMKEQRKNLSAARQADYLDGTMLLEKRKASMQNRDLSQQLHGYYALQAEKRQLLAMYDCGEIGDTDFFMKYVELAA